MKQIKSHTKSYLSKRQSILIEVVNMIMKLIFLKSFINIIQSKYSISGFRNVGFYISSKIANIFICLRLQRAFKPLK